MTDDEIHVFDVPDRDVPIAGPGRDPPDEPASGTATETEAVSSDIADDFDDFEDLDAESRQRLSAAGAAAVCLFLPDGDRPDDPLSALETALAATQGGVEPVFPEPNSAFEDAFWVLRIAATATRRAAGYSVWSGVRTGLRMVRAVASARSFDDFIEEYERIAFDEMDRLGLDSNGGGAERRKQKSEEQRDKAISELKERGTGLLERSADIHDDEDLHPAFPHILDQIAPDEARILRFLATDGPQPAVNVRDVGWLPITSELVAAGLSMLGTEAGVRYEDRTQAYLGNLNRLGLVWFCDEAVEDVKRYQLVEAQPDVKEAIEGCTRAKVVRRSVHLTPFGVDFCRVCLSMETISEDASGVYQTPDDRTRRVSSMTPGDGGSFDGRQVRPRGRPVTNGGTPIDDKDGVINPHVHNHWENET